MREKRESGSKLSQPPPRKYRISPTIIELTAAEIGTVSLMMVFLMMEGRVGFGGVAVDTAAAFITFLRSVALIRVRAPSDTGGADITVVGTEVGTPSTDGCGCNGSVGGVASTMLSTFVDANFASEITA